MIGTKDNILSEMQPIFREVLENEQIEIQEQTSANDLEEWDSVSHLMLLHALEGHFKVKFELREIMQFGNVGDIIQSILSK